jgi:hypothetical protein
MKKILIFTILLLVTTVVFSQNLKDNANARIEDAGNRSSQFDDAISEMEGRLQDNQYGSEYHRIINKMNTLETNLFFLRRQFNEARTPSERETILNQYKEKKSEYDSTRQELQRFVGTLK